MSSKRESRRAAEFLRLLEPEIKPLMKFLAASVMNKDDAEDLYQDTVLIAYEHFDDLNSKKAFPAWLRACARTAVSRKFRKMVSREQPIGTSEQAEKWQILNSQPEEDVEASVIRRLDKERLSRLVARLSYTERSFLSLRYGQEMAYKEIAEMLNTTPGYLAVLNQRIIMKLKEME